MWDLDDWVIHFERKAEARLKEIFEKDLGETPNKMLDQLERLRLAEEQRSTRE